MRLADKLNMVLQSKCLYPGINSDDCKIDICGEALIDTAQPNKQGHAVTKNISPVAHPNHPTNIPALYNDITEAITHASEHTSDDFGIITMIVRFMDHNLVIPMKVGNYIVDDVQKAKNGYYQVNIVRDQR